MVKTHHVNMLTHDYYYYYQLYLLRIMIINFRIISLKCKYILGTTSCESSLIIQGKLSARGWKRHVCVCPYQKSVCLLRLRSGTKYQYIRYIAYIRIVAFVCYKKEPVCKAQELTFSCKTAVPFLLYFYSLLSVHFTDA